MNMAAKKKEALPTSKAVSLAIAGIQKFTGQKPMSMDVSTIPHIPTGSMVVNNLIGGSIARDGKGQVCPGIPRQRVTEIYGAESSGKTTMAICTAVKVQNEGGSVMYLDFEHALHHGYAQACGLSFEPDKLMLYQPESLEQGLKMMFVGIRAGVDLIIVDSVAAMVPEAEMVKGLDETAKIGAVAKKLSEVLPKLAIWLKGRDVEDEDGKKKTEEGKTALVFLNQTRALISTASKSPDTENTAGGKALKFYASIRLRLARIRSDFVEKKDEMTLKKKRIPYGNLVQVKVVKNKLDSRQGHTGEIFIRYGYGIDDYHSVIENATARKLIKKEGTFYSIGDQKFRGKDLLRKFLMSDQKVFDNLKDKLTEALLSTATVVTGDVDDDDIVSSDGTEMFDDLEDSMPESEEVVEGEEGSEA